MAEPGSGPITVEFGADIQDLVKGIEDALRHISGFGTAVADAFGVNQIVEAGEKIYRVFESLIHIAEQYAKMGQQALSASAVLGTSTEEISKFQYAAGELGIGAESAVRGLERMERNIVRAAQGSGEAAQVFKALGIEVRDGVEGPIKNLDKLLPEIAERFHNTRNSMEKTDIAFALFGARMGAQLLPFLNEGKEGLEEFGRAAEASGSKLSQGAAEALNHTDKELFLFSQSLKGAGRILFEIIEPALDTVVHWLNRMLETVVKLGATWIAAHAPALLTEKQLQDALKDSQAEIDKTIARMNLFKSKHDRGMEMSEQRKLNALVIQHNALIGEQIDRQIKLKKENERPKLPEMEKPDKMDSQVKQWEEQLRRILILEDIHHDQLQARQLKFWQNIVATAKEGSDEWWAAREKVYNLDLQKQAEVEQNAKELARKKTQAAIEEIHKEEREMREVLHRIGEEQIREREKAMEKERQAYKNLAGIVTGAFDQMLNGILQGTQTWQQLMGRLFSNLAITFATKLVNKMVEDWFAGETAKYLASQIAATGTLGTWLMSMLGIQTAATATAAVQGTTAVAAATTQVAASTAVTPVIVANNAVQAGSGAAASAAPIPYVGWAIALAAGAAVLAGVLAMRGSMKSARGGWVVDEDTIANVHKNEMVLPAHLSKGIQNMIQGGQSGGAQGGKSGGNNGPNIALTVQAIDARSFMSFVQQPALMRQLSKALGAYRGQNPSLDPA